MPAPRSTHTVELACERPSPLLHYSGIPQPGDLDRLLMRAENIVVQRTADRRPFRAVIECLQNLERHAAPGTPICFRLEGRTVQGEPRFRIRTVNHIRQGESSRVQAWLERQAQWEQTLTSASGQVSTWRNWHRDALQFQGRTPRGGAGLGWISLARHAVRPPFIGLRQGGRGERLHFSIEVACAA